MRAEGDRRGGQQPGRRPGDAGRGEARHPKLGLSWVDGGYANKVDASIIPWARENTGIEVVVVKRNDVKGFGSCPGAGSSSGPTPGSQPTAG